LFKQAVRDIFTDSLNQAHRAVNKAVDQERRRS
jgi:hypothetical protein